MMDWTYGGRRGAAAELVWPAAERWARSVGDVLLRVDAAVLGDNDGGRDARVTSR